MAFQRRAGQRGRPSSFPTRRWSSKPRRRASGIAILRSRTAHLSLWIFDKAAAYEYGRIYAELRRLGRLMQVPDIQIAAIALSLGNCVVVSKDGDLRAVPGLAVEDWSLP